MRIDDIEELRRILNEPHDGITDIIDNGKTIKVRRKGEIVAQFNKSETPNPAS